MLTTHVAVVPYEAPHDSAQEQDLLHVAAALQVQLVRDLAPIWGVSGTVAPFLRLEDVPPGYWPLALVDELPLRRQGLHFASGGRPFALVKKDAGWSRLASHELLELICDPWGNRTVAGRSLLDAERGSDQGQVEYLVEVCDPCQKFTYTINGVLLSDFVTPQYYDPMTTRGARYSFTGAVEAPRTVLDGGYLTWRVPDTGEIWQAFGRGEKTEFDELSVGELPSQVSLREWVDDYSGRPAPTPDLDRHRPPLDRARRAYQLAVDSADDYGRVLRRDIRRLFEDVERQEARLVDLRGRDVDRVRELICALAQDDDVRGRFAEDPEAELAKRGISGRELVPASATPLPPKEKFRAACEFLSAGNRYGDTSNVPLGPFWWLAVLGGG